MWPNPQETADLVTFTGEIFNAKLHFLCSDSRSATRIFFRRWHKVLKSVGHPDWQPSWHDGVVTTLWQRRGWRCHNVVVWSKMRFVTTSVSDIVTTSDYRNVRELQKYLSIEFSLWQARRTQLILGFARF